MKRTGDIRCSWVDVTTAAGPILLRLGCATKMAVFWSYFRDFVGAQKIEDLSESKTFFAELFWIKSRFVLGKKIWGVRCTLKWSGFSSLSTVTVTVILYVAKITQNTLTNDLPKDPVRSCGLQMWAEELRESSCSNLWVDREDFQLRLSGFPSRALAFFCIERTEGLRTVYRGGSVELPNEMKHCLFLREPFFFWRKD